MDKPAPETETTETAPITDTPPAIPAEVNTKDAVQNAIAKGLAREFPDGTPNSLPAQVPPSSDPLAPKATETKVAEGEDGDAPMTLDEIGKSLGVEAKEVEVPKEPETPKETPKKGEEPAKQAAEGETQTVVEGSAFDLKYMASSGEEITESLTAEQMSEKLTELGKLQGTSATERQAASDYEKEVEKLTAPLLEAVESNDNLFAHIKKTNPELFAELVEASETLESSVDPVAAKNLEVLNKISERLDGKTQTVEPTDQEKQAQITQIKKQWDDGTKALKDSTGMKTLKALGITYNEAPVLERFKKSTDTVEQAFDHAYKIPMQKAYASKLKLVKTDNKVSKRSKTAAGRGLNTAALKQDLQKPEALKGVTDPMKIAEYYTHGEGAARLQS